MWSTGRLSRPRSKIQFSIYRLIKSSFISLCHIQSLRQCHNLSTNSINKKIMTISFADDSTILLPMQRPSQKSNSFPSTTLKKDEPVKFTQKIITYLRFTGRHISSIEQHLSSTNDDKLFDLSYSQIRQKYSIT
jgi:hypothetical protein